MSKIITKTHPREFAVANLIIELARKYNIGLSRIRLNNLLLVCQSWMVVKHNRNLFDAPIMMGGISARVPKVWKRFDSSDYIFEKIDDWDSEFNITTYKLPKDFEYVDDLRKVILTACTKINEYQLKETVKNLGVPVKTNFTKQQEIELWHNLNLDDYEKYYVFARIKQACERRDYDLDDVIVKAGFKNKIDVLNSEQDLMYEKFANFLNTTVEYLKGETDNIEPDPNSYFRLNTQGLSENEIAYLRNQLIQTQDDIRQRLLKKKG